METTNESSDFTESDRTNTTEEMSNTTTDSNETVIETEVDSHDRSQDRYTNPDDERIFSDLREQLESNPQAFVSQNLKFLEGKD